MTRRAAPVAQAILDLCASSGGVVARDEIARRVGRRAPAALGALVAAGLLERVGTDGYRSPPPAAPDPERPVDLVGWFAGRPACSAAEVAATLGAAAAARLPVLAERGVLRRLADGRYASRLASSPSDPSPAATGRVGPATPPRPDAEPTAPPATTGTGPVATVAGPASSEPATRDPAQDRPVAASAIGRPDGTDDPGTPTSAGTGRPMPCAYGLDDAARLDPGSLRHPIPRALELLVDRSASPRLLRHVARAANLSMVESVLPAGSLMVRDRMIVDHVDSATFEASMVDRAATLVERAEALAGTGLHRIMLIEGGPYAVRRYGLNRLSSTLSYLQNVHGIHLVPTMDARHSAYMAVQSIKHHLFGMFSDPTATTARDRSGSPGNGVATAGSMLRAIPGISSTRADALLLRFGSLRALAAAHPDALAEVDGIGSTIADRISRALASGGDGTGGRG